MPENVFVKNPVFRPDIVVTPPVFTEWEEIRSYFPRNRLKSVLLNEGAYPLEQEALIDFIGSADGAIIGRDRITGRVLESCSKLRIIAKYGVGLDNLDMDACHEHGVIVKATAGTNRLSVAEHTLGFMIMLAHRINNAAWRLRQGEWAREGGYELSGKTIGIIGVGNVGKELVRLLQPFNCRILVNDIIDQKEFYTTHQLEEKSKDHIFAEADVVTLHTPLTDLTRRMIGRDQLKAMKPTAVLINTARGAIVCESDLKWALKNRIIAGAALDVFDPEPPTDIELLSWDSVISTPHTAGSAREAIIRGGKAAIDHLVRHLLNNESEGG